MESRERTTLLLRRLSEGDPSVSDELWGAIRGELHRMASRQMARRGAAHTLQPTALVHEAWMRLVDADGATWASRGHFYAMAAKVMRSILVDHARRNEAEKRGGKRARVPLVEREEPDRAFSASDVLDLHETLGRLEAVDPERARVLELRYFGGLGVREIADVSGIPLRTVERRIQAATAWMRERLKGET